MSGGPFWARVSHDIDLRTPYDATKPRDVPNTERPSAYHHLTGRELAVGDPRRSDMLQDNELWRGKDDSSSPNSRVRYDEDTLRITVGNDRCRTSSNLVDHISQHTGSLYRHADDRSNETVLPGIVRYTSKGDGAAADASQINLGHFAPSGSAASKSEWRTPDSRREPPRTSQPSFSQQTSDILSRLESWKTVPLRSDASKSGIGNDRSSPVGSSSRPTVNSTLQQNLLKNINLIAESFGGRMTATSASSTAETMVVRSTSNMLTGVSRTAPLSSGASFNRLADIQQEPALRTNSAVMSSAEAKYVAQTRQDETGVKEKFSLKYRQPQSSNDSSSAAPSCDPVFADVLKSIGFNIDLSKFGADRSQGDAKTTVVSTAADGVPRPQYTIGTSNVTTGTFGSIGLASAGQTCLMQPSGTLFGMPMQQAFNPGMTALNAGLYNIGLGVAGIPAMNIVTHSSGKSASRSRKTKRSRSRSDAHRSRSRSWSSETRHRSTSSESSTHRRRLSKTRKRTPPAKVSKRPVKKISPRFKKEKMRKQDVHSPRQKERSISRNKWSPRKRVRSSSRSSTTSLPRRHRSPANRKSSPYEPRFPSPVRGKSPTVNVDRMPANVALPVTNRQPSYYPPPYGMPNLSLPPPPVIPTAMPPPVAIPPVIPAPSICPLPQPPWLKLPPAFRSKSEEEADWERSTEEFLRRMQQPNTVCKTKVARAPRLPSPGADSNFSSISSGSIGIMDDEDLEPVVENSGDTSTNLKNDEELAQIKIKRKRIAELQIQLEELRHCKPPGTENQENTPDLPEQQLMIEISALRESLESSLRDKETKTADSMTTDGISSASAEKPNAESGTTQVKVLELTNEKQKASMNVREGDTEVNKVKSPVAGFEVQSKMQIKSKEQNLPRRMQDAEAKKTDEKIIRNKELPHRQDRSPSTRSKTAGKMDGNGEISRNKSRERTLERDRKDKRKADVRSEDRSPESRHGRSHRGYGDTEYKDGGQHFCTSCKLVYDTLSAFVTHLESSTHKQQLKDKLAKEKKKTGKNCDKRKYEYSTFVKGVEFLEFVMEPFFCKLCYVFCGDHEEAKTHLLTPDHNVKYKKFIADDICYERELSKLKTKAKEMTEDGAGIKHGVGKRTSSSSKETVESKKNKSSSSKPNVNKPKAKKTPSGAVKDARKAQKGTSATAETDIVNPLPNSELDISTKEPEKSVSQAPLQVGEHEESVMQPDIKQIVEEGFKKELSDEHIVSRVQAEESKMEVDSEVIDSRMKFEESKMELSTCLTAEMEECKMHTSKLESELCRIEPDVQQVTSDMKPGELLAESVGKQVTCETGSLESKTEEPVEQNIISERDAAELIMEQSLPNVTVDLVSTAEGSTVPSDASLDMPDQLSTPAVEILLSTNDASLDEIRVSVFENVAGDDNFTVAGTSYSIETLKTTGSDDDSICKPSSPREPSDSSSDVIIENIEIGEETYSLGGGLDNVAVAVGSAEVDSVPCCEDAVHKVPTEFKDGTEIRHEEEILLNVSESYSDELSVTDPVCEKPEVADGIHDCDSGVMSDERLGATISVSVDSSFVDRELLTVERPSFPHHTETIDQPSSLNPESVKDQEVFEIAPVGTDCDQLREIPEHPSIAIENAHLLEQRADEVLGSSGSEEVQIMSDIRNSDKSLHAADHSAGSDDNAAILVEGDDESGLEEKEVLQESTDNDKEECIGEQLPVTRNSSAIEKSGEMSSSHGFCMSDDIGEKSLSTCHLPCNVNGEVENAQLRALHVNDAVDGSKHVGDVSTDSPKDDLSETSSLIPSGDVPITSEDRQKDTQSMSLNIVSVGIECDNEQAVDATVNDSIEQQSTPECKEVESETASQVPRVTDKPDSSEPALLEPTDQSVHVSPDVGQDHEVTTDCAAEDIDDDFEIDLL